MFTILAAALYERETDGVSAPTVHSAPSCEQPQAEARAVRPQSAQKAAELVPKAPNGKAPSRPHSVGRGSMLRPSVNIFKALVLGKVGTCSPLAMKNVLHRACPVH